MDATRRYAALPTRRHVRADGSVVVFRARRYLPHPGEARVASLTLSGPDRRVDLIAARELGSAGRWWQLCDANLVMSTDEIEHAPGRAIRVPVIASGGTT